MSISSNYSQGFRGKPLRNRFNMFWRTGFIWMTAAPWITLILNLALVWIVGERLRIQPGVVFELPSAPFREGMHQGLTVVMLPVSRPSGQNETLVFFEDEPYNISNTTQPKRLGDALRNRALRETRRELLLLADRRVPHGDVMQIVELARSVGIQRINVATKPE